MGPCGRHLCGGTEVAVRGDRRSSSKRRFPSGKGFRGSLPSLLRVLCLFDRYLLFIFSRRPFFVCLYMRVFHMHDGAWCMSIRSVCSASLRYGIHYIALLPSAKLFMGKWERPRSIYAGYPQMLRLCRRQYKPGSHGQWRRCWTG